MGEGLSGSSPRMEAHDTAILRVDGGEDTTYKDGKIRDVSHLSLQDTYEISSLLSVR
jgi:hypothetical protein